MSLNSGIVHQSIQDTPIAVVDFETTGLSPGNDRVVEISVVKIAPGRSPELVFDTLINPTRHMAATEVHGITDGDVVDAPRFEDIAGDFVAALSGCVVAAYNVYFDIKFLRYEMQRAGVEHEPPHFCVMYMRPMLGLGNRCKLDEACRAHDVNYEATHVASDDALAAANLLAVYLREIAARDISTFSDLAKLKRYKFVDSFSSSPMPAPASFNLTPSDRIVSRAACTVSPPVDPERHAIGAYWDALRTVLSDLEITPEEVTYISNERHRLGLKDEQIRVLHARVFSSVIAQFVDDKWLDDREVLKLRQLRRCLSQLGWAPGD